MQQQEITFLTQTIQQHHFYNKKTNDEKKIVFRMTPLLQYLKAPTDNPVERYKRENALYHFHHPIPPLRQEKDRKNIRLLLLKDLDLSSLKWKDAVYLMGVAYKYRHYLYCLTQDRKSYATHDALIIQHANDKMEIKRGSVVLNGKPIPVERSTPEERTLAIDLFTNYLQCIKSIYTNKAPIINQIFYGSQRVNYLPATDVARSRIVSKQIKNRHPAQRKITYLLETIKIPLHIIKICRLENMVAICPEITQETYQKSISPLFASFESVQEQGFDFKINQGIQKEDFLQMIKTLFPTGTKECVRYILFETFLEVHIHCDVWVQEQSTSNNKTLCHGIFSLRFHSDFVEYTQTFVYHSIIYFFKFLSYNKDEEDTFLGWDVDEQHGQAQYQFALKQILKTNHLPENANEFVKKLVVLLQNAVLIQTTKKNIPKSFTNSFKWTTTEDEQAGSMPVYIFPSLS